MRHPFLIILLRIFITKIPEDSDLGRFIQFLTMGPWLTWLFIVTVIGFVLNRICRKHLKRGTFEHVRKKSEYFESSEEKILKNSRGYKKYYEEWKKEWSMIEDEIDEFSISIVRYDEIDKFQKESKFLELPAIGK